MTMDALEADPAKIRTPQPGAPQQAALGLAGFKWPWLTLALLAVLIVIFVMENLFAIPPSAKSGPGVATLFAMGGLSRQAILSGGQWYRLFTAPLLHASFPHILGNGVALILGGMLVERLVGRLWFFALFVVSALGGSLVSLAITPPYLVSVGASGALMGLFAALLVVSFRVPAGTAARTKLQIYSLRTLIPSLLPLFSLNSGIHIDYGAHIGGALSGAALATVFFLHWPSTDRIPQLRAVAAGIAIVGAVLLTASTGIAIGKFSPSSVAALPPTNASVPPTQLPAHVDTATDGRAAYLRGYKMNDQLDRSLGTCARLFPTGKGAVPGINCAK
jgi:rhomboid protease GluP